MVDYVTVGEVTLDDTVSETGQVRLRQMGGGSLYSAFGIHLWEHCVGISSVVGHDYPKEYLEELQQRGLDIEGVHRIPGWSLRLWLLHEEENRKQQVPKLRSSSFQDLDAARTDPPTKYAAARAFHLAPATPQGQMRARDWIRTHTDGAIISLDLLSAPFIDRRPYLDGSVFRGIDVASPSINEIEALWPDEPLRRVLVRFRNWGVRWVAIKMDTRGALVYDAEKESATQIAIYPARPVDTTGAGDAFAGGFLEGIVETGDIVRAGVRGTVAASFAIESWGARHMLQISSNQAREREARMLEMQKPASSRLAGP